MSTEADIDKLLADKHFLIETLIAIKETTERKLSTVEMQKIIKRLAKVGIEYA